MVNVSFRDEETHLSPEQQKDPPKVMQLGDHKTRQPSLGFSGEALRPHELREKSPDVPSWLCLGDLGPRQRHTEGATRSYSLDPREASWRTEDREGKDAGSQGQVALSQDQAGEQRK